MEFRASPTDEQLLVADDGAEVGLGLFLEPAVLARLDAANPLDTLNGANLADYWTALEGVSHFVYLAWNADHDRPVSLLELDRIAETYIRQQGATPSFKGYHGFPGSLCTSVNDKVVHGIPSKDRKHNLLFPFLSLLSNWI